MAEVVAPVALVVVALSEVQAGVESCAASSINEWAGAVPARNCDRVLARGGVWVLARDERGSARRGFWREAGWRHLGSWARKIPGPKRGASPGQKRALF